MTENEAKLILEEIKQLDDTMYAYLGNYMKALDMAIKALEEIKEYRKIGTVEECREAVEKTKEKKPKFYATNWYCPECGNLVGNSEFQWEKHFAEGAVKR